MPKEAERVESLAQQLLDLSRPRTYNFRRADLHKTIGDTLALWRPGSDQRSITLIATLHAESPHAIIDVDAIRQVIINLLRNALEAVMNRPDERIIKVVTRNAEGRLLIEIEDNGPGISPDIRDRLFDAFSSDGKPSGTGLGLAICNEIVKSHGGLITVESAQDSGCIFRVVLANC